MKILIVDDSVVFRTQISQALAAGKGIEIAGTAANGSIALQKLDQMPVDLVTLDMEMPDMNGLDVLKEIRKRGKKVRVIIFSSQTPRGAAIAIEALNAGADDVVAKPSGEGMTYDTANKAIQDALLPKIYQFMDRGFGSDLTTLKSPTPTAPTFIPSPVSSTSISQGSTSAIPKRDITFFKPSMIVIGSSTGGPAALEKIFSSIKAPINIPILITQHMPPVFTEMLARRLSEMTGIPCAEAKNGEVIRQNQMYIAPGDYHMLVVGNKAEYKILLNQDAQRNSVRPAVDYLFETAADIFDRNCMGFVLTGMGEDGLIGAQALRRKGAAMMIQDKESCVVFGMPGAIFSSGDYDQIGNLETISATIRRMTA